MTLEKPVPSKVVFPGYPGSNKRNIKTLLSSFLGPGQCIVFILALVGCEQPGRIVESSNEYVRIFSFAPSGSATAKTAHTWCSRFGKVADNLRITNEIYATYDCVADGPSGQEGNARQPNTDKGDEAEIIAVSGSGFFVSSIGIVLTNHHVVRQCNNIGVSTSEKELLTATVVALDRINDLAALRVPRRADMVGVFRRGKPVRQGEDVVIYGFPLRGALASTGNLTRGTVTALAGISDDTRYIQVSAQVQPGNSGGPVIDRQGNIVGVVAAKLDAIQIAKVTGDIPQNVNFAVKSSIARAFLHANNIDYEERMVSQDDLQIPEIGDRARKYAVKVSCSR